MKLRGSKLNRKKARTEAFYLIFEKCFKDDENLEQIKNTALEARDYESDDFIDTLSNGVIDNLEKIDVLIEENLKGWKFNRISKVNISILRLAVYEMLFEDSVPVSVSINEAVELAKKFSDQKDASYINGVLGSIAKKHCSEE